MLILSDSLDFPPVSSDFQNFFAHHFLKIFRRFLIISIFCWYFLIFWNFPWCFMIAWYFSYGVFWNSSFVFWLSDYFNIESSYFQKFLNSSDFLIFSWLFLIIWIFSTCVPKFPKLSSHFLFFFNLFFFNFPIPKLKYYFKTLFQHSIIFPSILNSPGCVASLTNDHWGHQLFHTPSFVPSVCA